MPFLEARHEVINRLTNVNLPDGVQPSIIPSPMGEVMQYVVTGSNNLMDLRTFQDWVVGRYIKTAQGVEDVASYGGFIKAYVVLESEARGKISEEEIINFCKENLAHYKVPKIIEFRGELPKTDVGKVSRRELREESEEK